ncbi:MAG: chemotaxis protein CheA [Candidatus Goldbacteria bacterium]|nr:chemotaxis protein CheA [Candidatus Goldiibacteriota bacterium]
MKETDVLKALEELSVEFVMADFRNPESYSAAAEKARFLSELVLSKSAEEKQACKRILENITALLRGTGSESVSAAVADDIAFMKVKADLTGKEKKPRYEAALGIASAIRKFSEAVKAQGNDNAAKAAERAAESFESAIKRGNAGDAPHLFENMLASIFQGEDRPKDTVKEETLPEIESVISGDLSLVGDFINEAREHLENINSGLLAVEANPGDEEAVNSLFRAFHTMKSLSGFFELIELHMLVKEVENVLSGARKGAIVFNGAVIDILFSAADAVRKMVDALKDNPSKKTGLITSADLDAVLDLVLSITGAPAGAEKQRLGEILVQEGKLKEAQLTEALEEQKATHEKLGEILENKNTVSEADVAGALQEQKITKESDFRIKETVKIDLEKLDNLIDTIGEIVIAESMVVNALSLSADSSVISMGNINHLHKTTKTLHELGLSLRLIPVAGMFQKMARVARDLSRKHGKKINFAYHGEDTEIDRTVVEKISDPLIHMIRNSIDHGIESEKERKDAGKPETAQVELNAYHKGGNICIELSDDGSGLNRQKILKRAVENGLVDAETQMPDQEIFEFIFRPGFSTASMVTDTSGRGVGMDVVKRNVEQLRGRVEVVSKPGAGTKFTVVLPLTTAIIEAITVRVNEEKYFVPSLSIVESSKPPAQLFSTVAGKGVMLAFRDTLVPVFSLSALLNKKESIKSTTSGEKIVVIIEENGKMAGIAVDEILEPQQIVVKNLGKSFGKIEGIAACTIMSDGKVGLILDINGIIKMATAG